LVRDACFILIFLEWYSLFLRRRLGDAKGVKALGELGRPQRLASGRYGVRLGGEGVYKVGKASK
jgi:hypothetical protein